MSTSVHQARLANVAVETDAASGPTVAGYADVAVCEVVAAAGPTMRTLYHYDRLGLWSRALLRSLDGGRVQRVRPGLQIAVASSVNAPATRSPRGAPSPSP